MYFSIFFLLFTSIGVLGQSYFSSKADELLESGRYAQAMNVYKRYFLLGSCDSSCLHNAGLCAMKLGDLDDADFFIDKLKSKYSLSESLTLEYLKTLIKQERYEVARESAMHLLSSPDYKTMAAQIIATCDSAITWKKAPTNVIVRNYEFVNTEFSDFAPARFQNGLVFCSTREHTIIKRKSKKSGEPLSDLYFANLKGESDKLSIVAFSNVNTDLHEGAATFNNTYDTIYFSRNGESKSNNHLKLLSATLINRKWKKPEDFMLNDSSFSFAHPCISKDGNLFFFSSNMAGGFGGTDIYVCIKADSNWSLPINLGNRINTAGNEIFPFFTQQEELYFASDTHIGMGGFDIFLANLQDGEWQSPTNLKSPINSGADDFAFVLFSSWPDGYFTTNRAGGKGKEDIYKVEKK